MYLNIIAIALCCNAIMSDVSSEHAFYVSVVEVKHVAHTTEAELTIKVFSDDMQDALRNASESDSVLELQEICNAHQEDVNTYFGSHISVHVNDSLGFMELTECEEVGDTYRFRFTMDCPAKWNEIKIYADFLMELFPTQSQMIYVTHGDHTATLRLTANRKSQTISFTQ